MPGIIVQPVVYLTADRGIMFEPHLSHITYMEIDHETIPTAILPLPLIQEGQLSVTDESMCKYKYSQTCPKGHMY